MRLAGLPVDGEHAVNCDDNTHEEGDDKDLHDVALVGCPAVEKVVKEDSGDDAQDRRCKKWQHIVDGDGVEHDGACKSRHNKKSTVGSGDNTAWQPTDRAVQRSMCCGGTRKYFVRLLDSGSAMASERCQLTNKLESNHLSPTRHKKFRQGNEVVAENFRCIASVMTVPTRRSHRHEARTLAAIRNAQLPFLLSILDRRENDNRQRGLIAIALHTDGLGLLRRTPRIDEAEAELDGPQREPGDVRRQDERVADQRGVEPPAEAVHDRDDERHGRRRLGLDDAHDGGHRRRVHDHGGRNGDEAHGRADRVAGLARGAGERERSVDRHEHAHDQGPDEDLHGGALVVRPAVEEVGQDAAHDHAQHGRGEQRQHVVDGVRVVQQRVAVGVQQDARHDGHVARVAVLAPAVEVRHERDPQQERGDDGQHLGHDHGGVVSAHVKRRELGAPNGSGG
ncbi:unnamed protein product [Phytophthora lilii]|uniref:Unnamed protein product n=1 Tax=Phytophthora lilii TaxID=2077276 RepID=A0A9W6TL87_9STRA|nr:unnamed protein product [Phytophthora lilii]